MAAVEALKIRVAMWMNVEMDQCPINRFWFVMKWTLLSYNNYIPLSDKSPVYFKNIITIGLIPPNKGHRLWPVVIRVLCLVIFDWLTMTSRAGLSARNKARVHCALTLRNINRKCSTKHVLGGLLFFKRCYWLIMNEVMFSKLLLRLNSNYE